MTAEGHLVGTVAVIKIKPRREAFETGENRAGLLALP
jgi:hypothetical protein